MRPTETLAAMCSLAAAVCMAAVVAGGETTVTGHQAPTPDMAQGAKPCAIDSLPRPTVLLTRKRLDVLRKRIAEPGRARDLYLGVLKPNVERWLARDIAIPAPGGHYHKFTCTDGTRLQEPPDQTIGATGPYRCPACGKEYSGPDFDYAKRNIEHVWLMRACRDLALDHALTGNRACAEKAADILRKYADAYPGRHTWVTKGGILFQSLDEAMHIIMLAQAYDLVFDAGVLSDADKSRIERQLFWECAAGLKACGTSGNWGSWHLSAVGVIGYATRHQALIDWSLSAFRAQIRDQLGEDGLWPESVHTYHFFPLRGFLLLAEAATNSGTDLYTWEAKPGKGLHAMLAEPVKYMYPDMRLPAINDGWFASFLPADMYELAWHRYREGLFAWVLNGRRGGDAKTPAGSAVRDDTWALVLGDPIPVDIVKPVIRSTNFPGIGICTLRNDDGPANAPMMMTFDYGRHLGHGQLDKMGVTLFGDGRLLAADYGTPAYGSAILPYYLGTASHNTVMVDGRNQEQTTRAELLHFSDGPRVKSAEARTDEAYPGVEWTRTVAVAGDWALVVDDLRSTTPRTFDWLLHCEGDALALPGALAIHDAAEMPEGAMWVRNADESTTLATEWFSDVQAYRVPAGRLRARWSVKGRTLLSASVLAGVSQEGDEPAKLNVRGVNAYAPLLAFTARCPAESGARKVPLLVLRRHGVRACFAVLLQPMEGRAKEATVALHPVGAISVKEGRMRTMLETEFNGPPRVRRFRDAGESPRIPEPR
jgi:hypothetical protein